MGEGSQLQCGRVRGLTHLAVAWKKRGGKVEGAELCSDTVVHLGRWQGTF